MGIYLLNKTKTCLKGFILMLFTLLTLNVSSQVLSVNLNVSPNPDPSIANWAFNSNTVFMTVLNASSQTYKYKIRAGLKYEGNLVADLNLNELPIYSIQGFQSNLYFVEDIIPESAVNIIDQELKTTYLLSNKLPAGFYELCVELVNANNNNEVISIQQCKSFFITDYSLPALILPANESKVDNTGAIIFQWSTLNPPYLFGLTQYNLRVFEVDEFTQQKPLDAFQYSNPIVDELLVANNFTWTLDNILPDDGKQYIWSVRAVDEDEKPISIDGFNGWVSPHTFTITNITGEPKSNDDIPLECDNCPNIAGLYITLDDTEREKNTFEVVVSNDYLVYQSGPKENYTINSYQLTIDWQDGNTSQINEYSSSPDVFSHSYEKDVPESIKYYYDIEWSYEDYTAYQDELGIWHTSSTITECCTGFYEHSLLPTRENDGDDSTNPSLLIVDDPEQGGDGDPKSMIIDGDDTGVNPADEPKGLIVDEPEQGGEGDPKSMVVEGGDPGVNQTNTPKSQTESENDCLSCGGGDKVDLYTNYSQLGFNENGDYVVQISGNFLSLGTSNAPSGSQSQGSQIVIDWNDGSPVQTYNAGSFAQITHNYGPVPPANFTVSYTYNWRFQDYYSSTPNGNLPWGWTYKCCESTFTFPIDEVECDDCQSVSQYVNILPFNTTNNSQTIQIPPTSNLLQGTACPVTNSNQHSGDFIILWGDGTTETVASSGVTQSFTHNYTSDWGANANVSVSWIMGWKAFGNPTPAPAYCCGEMTSPLPEWTCPDCALCTNVDFTNWPAAFDGNKLEITAWNNWQTFKNSCPSNYTNGVAQLQVDWTGTGDNFENYDPNGPWAVITNTYANSNDIPGKVLIKFYITDNVGNVLCCKEYEVELPCHICPELPYEEDVYMLISLDDANDPLTYVFDGNQPFTHSLFKDAVTPTGPNLTNGVLAPSKPVWLEIDWTGTGNNYAQDLSATPIHSYANENDIPDSIKVRYHFQVMHEGSEFCCIRELTLPIFSCPECECEGVPEFTFVQNGNTITINNVNSSATYQTNQTACSPTEEFIENNITGYSETIHMLVDWTGTGVPSAFEYFPDTNPNPNVSHTYASANDIPDKIIVRYRMTVEKDNSSSCCLKDVEIDLTPEVCDDCACVGADFEEFTASWDEDGDLEVNIGLNLVEIEDNCNTNIDPRYVVIYTDYTGTGNNYTLGFYENQNVNTTTYHTYNDEEDIPENILIKYEIVDSNNNVICCMEFDPVEVPSLYCEDACSGVSNQLYTSFTQIDNNNVKVGYNFNAIVNTSVPTNGSASNIVSMLIIDWNDGSKDTVNSGTNVTEYIFHEYTGIVPDDVDVSMAITWTQLEWQGSYVDVEHCCYSKTSFDIEAVPCEECICNNINFTDWPVEYAPNHSDSIIIHVGQNWLDFDAQCAGNYSFATSSMQIDYSGVGDDFVNYVHPISGTDSLLAIHDYNGATIPNNIIVRFTLLDSSGAVLCCKDYTVSTTSTINVVEGCPECTDCEIQNDFILTYNDSTNSVIVTDVSKHFNDFMACNNNPLYTGAVSFDYTGTGNNYTPWTSFQYVTDPESPYFYAGGSPPENMLIKYILKDEENNIICCKVFTVAIPVPGTFEPCGPCACDPERPINFDGKVSIDQNVNYKYNLSNVTSGISALYLQTRCDERPPVVDYGIPSTHHIVLLKKIDWMDGTTTEESGMLGTYNNGFPSHTYANEQSVPEFIELTYQIKGSYYGPNDDTLCCDIIIPISLEPGPFDCDDLNFDITPIQANNHKTMFFDGSINPLGTISVTDVEIDYGDSYKSHYANFLNYYDANDGTFHIDKEFRETKEYPVCMTVTGAQNGDTLSCDTCFIVDVGADCDAEVKMHHTKVQRNQHKFKNTSTSTNTIELVQWEITKTSGEGSSIYVKPAATTEINGAIYNVVPGDTVLFDNDSIVMSADQKYLYYQFSKKGVYEVCMTISVFDGVDTCYKTICETVEIKRNCQCSAATADCSNISTQTYAAGDIIFLNGGFEMILTEAPTGTNSNLTGKGEVMINWLLANMEVEFSGISVNTNDQLCSGEVFAMVYDDAPQYPTQWGINLVAGSPITDNVVTAVADWAEDKIEELPDLPFGVTEELEALDVGEELDQAIKDQIQPLRVPLGFNNVEGYTIAFSAFKWGADGNVLAGLTEFPIKHDYNEELAFEITNICFTNTGPGNPLAPGGSGGIKLRSDVKLRLAPGDENYVSDDSSFFMIIRQETPERLGTSFEFTSPCGSGKLDWCFRADIDFDFPRNWLVPIPDNGSQVTANIQTEICDWKDWIVMTELENCMIAASNGRVEMEVDMMAYDHSDLRNAWGMTFPQNYVGVTDETFQGFYLRQGRLRFPYVATYPDPEQALEVQLNDWIITGTNNGGVTGEVLAFNILNYPDGNITDMGASIDTVKVNILNSAFIQAYVRGRLVLPLSKDSISNALNYKVLYGHDALAEYDGFQFRLWPDGPIELGILDKAKLNIDPVSEATIEIPNAGGFANTELFFSLTGDMTLNQPFVVGNKTLNVEFEGVDFENLGGTYTANNSTFTPNPNIRFALSSPQKQMGKFPVTVENFSIVTRTKQGPEIFRGGLSADIICNLSDKIGGSTNLGLIGAIEKHDGEKHKFKPKFVDLELNSISVYANLSAVKLNGYVNFINGDPIYGDGFDGGITARFNSIGMDISANVLFGNTTYNAAERYRYWKVEAKAILPAPGIVFLPGIAFRGFGAGAYRHMSADFSNVTPIDGASTSSATPPPGSGGAVFDGAVFTPDIEKAFGFKVMAVVATTPKDETFNADVGISGEFTSSGGISYLRFDGDFFIGTKLTTRTDPIAFGNVFAQYDFPTKEFSMGASVNVNKYPVTANNFGFNLYINGSTNKWFFKAGTPTDYNTVNVFSVAVNSYLMFGNDIPTPTDWMASTRNGWNEAKLSMTLPTLDGGDAVNDDTQQGKGFAFGIGLKAGTSKSGHLTGRVDYNFSYGIGGELNLSLMEYVGSCYADGTTYNPIGMNGWRAKGGLALYGHLNFGLDIGAKGVNGGCGGVCIVYCCNNYPNGHYLPFFSGGFGAYVIGAFPRPSYMKGGFTMNLNILDLITMDYSAEFEVGANCTNAGGGTGPSFTQEDAADDQSTKLIVNVTPSGNNIDTTSPMKVTYGFLHNEPFDVPEAQSNGTILMRTFKAMYSVTLEERPLGGTYSTVPTQNKGINVLGQTEYIKSDGNFNTTYNEAASGLNTGPLVNSGSTGPSGQAAQQGKDNFASGVSTGGTQTQTQTQAQVNVQFNNNNTGSGTGVSNTEQAAVGLSDEFGSPINTSPPDPGYGNLPPPPPPIYNILEKKHHYRFTVVGNLYEMVNGNWVVATNNSGQAVSQTEEVVFFTGTFQESMVQQQAADDKFTPMNGGGSSGSGGGTTPANNQSTSPAGVNGAGNNSGTQTSPASPGKGIVAPK